MDDLEEVEDLFEVSIHVYSLQENKSAEVVMIPEKSYEKSLHLDLYDSLFIHYQVQVLCEEISVPYLFSIYWKC